MKCIVYHSAFQIKQEFEYLCWELDFFPKILKSFYGNANPNKPKWCSGLFLDSGAFSAFRSNAHIDLRDYISFCKSKGTFFDAYANLDVIGNPEKTLKNQKEMDSFGLKAIPTYHVGEPLEILKYYCEKYDYIALGGMVPYAGSSVLYSWLQDVWGEINEKTKVHGFGLTDLNLVKIYPWYSIDSTTAARAGRVGVLITPWGQLRVSEKIKTKTGATINSPKKIETIIKWGKEIFPNLNLTWNALKAGTTEAGQLRSLLNAYYIEHTINKYGGPYKKKRNFGLFN